MTLMIAMVVTMTMVIAFKVPMTLMIAMVVTMTTMIAIKVAMNLMKAMVVTMIMIIAIKVAMNLMIVMVVTMTRVIAIKWWWPWWNWKPVWYYYIHLSASRDVHFDKRMICFLSGPLVKPFSFYLFCLFSVFINVHQSQNHIEKHYHLKDTALLCDVFNPLCM